MNCFKPSRHRSAKCIKYIDISSRNRRNRFAHVRCPTPGTFPYHWLSMGTRWVPGGYLVVSSSGITSHYLLARYSTDRGPCVYIQTSDLIYILDPSSSSPSFIFFFVLLFYPSLSRPDNPLIFLSFSFFSFFSLSLLSLLTSRELKRELAITRQDLFAKTQRVIFASSAIAIFAVINTGHCTSNFHQWERKDNSHESCDCLESELNELWLRWIFGWFQIISFYYR